MRIKIEVYPFEIDHVYNRTPRSQKVIIFLKITYSMQNLIVFIDGQCHKAITVFIDI